MCAFIAIPAPLAPCHVHERNAPNIIRSAGQVHERNAQIGEIAPLASA